MSKFKPSRSNAVRPRPVQPPPVKLARSGSGPSSPSGSGLQEVPEPAGPAESSEEVSTGIHSTGIQKIGFAATLLFVFFRFSFAHEFIAAKFNFNAHLVSIAGAAAYLCCVLSGQMFRALRERSTWMWIGFAACITVATLTSGWKGGSLPLLADYLATSFPILIVLPAFATTKGQIGQAINTMGLACITMVVLALFNDEFKAGRMNIDMAGSDIQDPNDYAAHLILMLPALAYLALRAGRPIVMKLIGIGVAACSFLQILSTGSRGGFLSLALTTVYVALTGSKRIKAAILVCVPVAALAAIPFVPSQSMARLYSLFSSSASSPSSAEALESKEARMALLQESWKATLSHPLTGVGPGIFMDYQAAMAKENGQRGMWHVTHNSYTEVSSECGLPAMVLYICALGSTFFLLRSCRKSQDPELAAMAAILSVMLVGFGICMFFLSMAYNVQILVLSALAVALKQRVQAAQESPDRTNSTGLPVDAALPA